MWKIINRVRGGYWFQGHGKSEVSKENCQTAIRKQRRYLKCCLI
ncbi:hypothetical protein V6Z11_A10G123700 [Gossypium hirsutum]